MPYKEKTCEQCHDKHTKRGRFCSRTCSDEANKNRRWTPEQKQAVADGLREWHATSETAEVAAHNFISKGNNKTPEPPLPPTAPRIGNKQFVQDGDLWEEA
jgi:hypothetical protein